MCSERGLGSASRERPVDRPETCYCPVPESVQVILKRIQMLSFADCTEGGPYAGNCTPVHAWFSQEDAQAA
jgi:hypothetical protein